MSGARHRPRLAMRVGEELVGGPNRRATPRAVAVLSTRQDGSTYTWEEWQLVGHDGSDMWVEYDHDSRDVTLFHPTEAWPPVVDLSALRTGGHLDLRLDGQQHRLAVRERGTGLVERVEGSFAEPFVVGQTVEYADLAGHGFVVSIERTGGHYSSVTSTYRGKRIDAAEQRRLFGRRLGPRSWGGGRVVAVALGLVAFFSFAACEAVNDSADSSCTPRTVVTTSPTTGQVGTVEEGGTCVRRSVYGGGGLGK